jgi:hypothetical protein
MSIQVSGEVWKKAAAPDDRSVCVSYTMNCIRVAQMASKPNAIPVAVI